jgi:methyl-accepting chemotaxis protein
MAPDSAAASGTNMPMSLSLTAKLSALNIAGLMVLAVVLTFSSTWVLTARSSAQAQQQRERAIDLARLLVEQRGQGYAVRDGALFVGDYRLDGDTELVDHIRRLNGGVATVFRDDVRVATNVVDTGGKRAVGTRLAPGPVYDAVLKNGKPFRGEAAILGESYFTAYDPLFAADGKVVGILFVGLKSAEVLRVVDDVRAAILIIAPLVTFVFGLASFIMVRRQMATLKRLGGAMRDLAALRLDVTIPGLGRRDEVGEMAQAVAVFKDNAVEKRAMEEGERVRIEEERRDAVALRRREEAVGAEIAGLVEAVSAGDLTLRLDLGGKTGFFLAVSTAVNRLADTVQSIIADLGGVLSALADGDLTKRVKAEYHGTFHRVRDDVNTTADRLEEIAVRLADAAAAIVSASSEVSLGATDLSDRTERQAASIEETTATMHELGDAVRANARNAQTAKSGADAALRAARSGGTDAQTATGAIRDIERSSARITDIIGVIDEIAFQTNLLALNAAIEAARAGESGMGFAVVAQEVRNLARRTSEASREIKGLIVASNDQVRDGAALVKTAGESLTGIVEAVQRVDALIGEMATRSAEQAATLDEINGTIVLLDEMTQKNAALVEETSAVAQTMEDQAGELQRLVGYFKTRA